MIVLSCIKIVVGYVRGLEADVISRWVNHAGGCMNDVVIFYFFFFKQKTAYEVKYGLVGSEMCIRDRSTAGGTTSSMASRSATSRRRSAHVSRSSSCSIVRGPMITDVTMGLSLIPT